MDKYNLVTSQKCWFFRDMVEYVSKLYFSDLPEGNVLSFELIKGRIQNKIEQGINDGDIVEGVVGERQVMNTPDGLIDYFDLDCNSTCLSTSEVRGYLKALVLEDKLDAPDTFKQNFLGMAVEAPEEVSISNSAESASEEQAGGKPVSDYIFRKTSQSWHIKYNDSELLGVNDLVGMSYIHLLLQSPLKPIGVIDLQTILNSHQIKSGGYDESTANSNENSMSPPSKYKSANNASVMNSFKKRLQELAADRVSAENDNDLNALESIENEVEQIQEQIDLIQYGKQDKDPEIEANRKKVRKNIVGALLNIKKLEIASNKPAAPIYNYLNTHIKTGVTCCYNPPLDSQPCWTFY
jgi:gas vesicle protein